MFRIVCLALLASLASAVVTFKDCGHAEVKSVDVTNCANSPCALHKGKDVTVTVVFTSNQDTSKADLQLLAKIGELEIAIPGVDTDGCKHMECPLKKGTTYTFKYTLTVPAIAPTIEADVTAKLVGASGVLACGTVHGSIQD